MKMTYRIIVPLVITLAVVVGAWWYLAAAGSATRGEALDAAMQAVIEEPGTDRAMVARAIVTNYHETRVNAARWSGVYWGSTFVAAALSALAGLVLKLESVLKDEAAKKDVAAVLAVTAAILITISTSGDFQRKWQANRIAAAELERLGYQFLEKSGDNPRSYLARVANILMTRHTSIVGGAEPSAAPADVPAAKD